MSRLRIGLAVSADLGDALTAAIFRLGERAEIAAVEDGGVFDTVVRTSVASAPWGERTTLWAEHTDVSADDLARAVAVLAAPTVARQLRPGSPVPVLALGPAEVHRRARPVAPFTRARIRRARGLGADRAVGRHDGVTWSWDDRTVDASAAPTVAALASVLVTDQEDSALLGAAWGAPVVTPRPLAVELGLPVPSGRMEDPDDEVDRLLADPGACAEHAQGCRAAYLREHSADRSVLLLEETLRSRGIVRVPPDYAQALDVLGTPLDAVVRFRARQAVDSLRRPS